MTHDVTIGREAILRGLKRLGVCAGDILLVHSSLSRFGHVEGGAETVIDALLEAVRPGGTVMVPTLTGNSQLSASNPPVFDPVSTPCWTGRIPETFRARKNAFRSLHPTHSVASIGPRAEDLARDHEVCLTPCGIESPYGRLVRFGGKVVLLGVNHSSSTLFHHIEEIAELPYHMQKDLTTATVILPNGDRKGVTVGLHLYGPRRDFNRMEKAFRAHGVQRSGKIGSATVRVVSARGMVACALEALALDPDVLLKR